jgi:hypothetical protein
MSFGVRLYDNNVISVKKCLLEAGARGKDFVNSGTAFTSSRADARGSSSSSPPRQPEVAFGTEIALPAPKSPLPAAEAEKRVGRSRLDMRRLPLRSRTVRIGLSIRLSRCGIETCAGMGVAGACGNSRSELDFSSANFFVEIGDEQSRH